MNLKIHKNRNQKRSKIHYLKTIEQLQKDNFEATALSILALKKQQTVKAAAAKYELVYGKMLMHLFNTYKIPDQEWSYLDNCLDIFENETGHKLQRIG